MHTQDSMVFCIDTGAPISFIGKRTLKRIVQRSVRNFIPMIQSERDFQFGDTLIRSKSMIELILPTPGNRREIPVIMDVVDVDIPALLGIDVLDGNNLFVDNVAGHLWNRIITCKEPLQFEDRWKTQLIRKGEHLYVPLKAPIQSFYTMAQLRKLHKQIANPPAVKLYDLLKSAVLKAVTPKTLEKLE